MSGEQNIMREYLISLGFKVDGRGEKDLGNKLTDWDRKANALSKALAGVGVSAAAMVAEFAFRMERLYYASKLADSSAANLQALDFAGQQTGIKDFTGLVQNLARAIRLNPGIQGLIQSLGIPVEGRDRGQVLKDIIRSLDSMPESIAARYAGLFGIDPDSLHLLRGQVDELERWEARQKEINAALGVNADDAAKSGRELAQEWREVLTYMARAKDALIIEFLPAMHEFAASTKSVLADWVAIIRNRDAATAGKITDESARASGLTRDEQERAAMQASSPKRYTDMTPAEREAQGMPSEPASGKWWTVWDQLTPEERKEHGLPETEEQMSFSERMMRKGKQNFRSWFYGGAELTRQQKERLGQDGLRRENSGFLGETWNKVLDGIGYQSVRKTPLDPAAIDAATEPPVRAQDQPRQEPSVQTPTSASELISQLEKQHGLRAGALDYIWKAESGRSTKRGIYGPVTSSGARAEGPFQFMKGTASDYGLKDPQDFSESAKAAASYLSDLMAKYGDMRFAAAAYNWGSGKLDALMTRTMKEHPDFSQEQSDRYVLGHLPKETREYIAGIDPGGAAGGAGQTINMTADTKIDIHGDHDPKETARMIADSHKEVWSDVTRNFADKLR